jgi:hypothetical protein
MGAAAMPDMSQWVQSPSKRPKFGKKSFYNFEIVINGPCHVSGILRCLAGEERRLPFEGKKIPAHMTRFGIFWISLEIFWNSGEYFLRRMFFTFGS